MSSSASRTALLITAAGASTRMGDGVKKEFRFLKGKPVLSWSVEAFCELGVFDSMVITLKSTDIPEARRLLENSPYKNKIDYVPGGATRQESVRNGLKALQSLHPDYVMIHDGARPWITFRLIRSIYEGMLAHGACVSVIPASEAMKELKFRGEAGEDGVILRHLSRVSVLAAQTPQAFEFDGIMLAHDKAAAEGYSSVDDTDLYDRYIGPVYTVPGDPGNRKITFRHDVEEIMKTGFGWDSHRLVSGRPLVLGGVVIPFDKGEDGHSDGDVLVHAIIDALLGAAGLKDIGRHFPPEDPAYKGIASTVLLRRTKSMVAEKGLSICNIDCTVILEKPKLAPFMDAIVGSIATTLDLGPDLVSVKAKTREGLDSVGEGKAVEACAAVLLQG